MLKKWLALIPVLCLTACGVFSLDVQEEPIRASAPGSTRTSTPSPVVTGDFMPTGSPTPTISPTARPSEPPALAATPRFRPGESLLLTEVHMVTVDQGWGISGPSVLTTADGGLTWHEVTPPQDLPAGVEARVFGAFPGNQSAWVIYSLDDYIAPDAVVWSTIDGGRTWRASAPLDHQTVGHVSRAIFSVLNEYTGWLMVSGSSVAAGQRHSNQLFETFDGGASWTPVGLNEFGVNGIAFANPQIGWMTMECSGDCHPNANQVVATMDGGMVWQYRSLPEPSYEQKLFSEYEYCNSYQVNGLDPLTVRFLVSCYDYPLTTMVTYLYLTDNGGADWSSALLPATVDGPQSALIFFDAEHGLLLGREIYRTNDGGRSWWHVKDVTWDGQFNFVDERNGWAIARLGESSALVRTHDRGATWEELTPHIAP
mgnify:CR=1 FL=1